MPDNQFIQYGSFGVIVFLVGWFVLRGFPQVITALTASIDRVLMKIDSIESECRAERTELLKVFREEREADRVARHAMANQFTEMLARAIIPKNRHDQG